MTYAKDIDVWRAGISSIVDNMSLDSSLVRPIFWRQSNTLNMACWHAQLLVHRPFLIRNFVNSAHWGERRNVSLGRDESQTERHIRSCLDAAMNIADLVAKLAAKGQLYDTLWVCLQAYSLIPKLTWIVYALLCLLRGCDTVYLCNSNARCLTGHVFASLSGC